MKVLMCAYVCRPDAGSEPGVGWELLVAASRMHDVTLLTQTRDVARIQEGLSAAGTRQVRVIGVPGPAWLLEREGRMGTGHLDYLVWQVRAAALVRRLAGGMDLGHHVTYSNDWLPSALHVVSGLPVVWGPVGGYAPVPWRLVRYVSRRGLGRELSREVLTRAVRRASIPIIRRRTALVVAVNGDVGRRYRPLRLPIALEPHVAVPPAPAPDVSPLRDDHRLVFAARLSSWKGPRIALETLRLLPPPWHLDMYGSGAEEQELRTLATELGVDDRVTFRGNVPLDDLRTALSRAQAMLFPSMHDACPLTVAEAVRVGCPVLCLDVAGPPELLEGSPGAAVPPDRHAPRRLADAALAVRPGPPNDRWNAARLPAIIDSWYRTAAGATGSTTS